MPICAACSQDNPDGAIVCMNCAASLGSLCPSCSHVVPAGNQFCGQCGARTGEQPPVAPPTQTEMPVTLGSNDKAATIPRPPPASFPANAVR